VSGISGTGVVAEGVVFGDGRVAMRWTTNSIYSIVIHSSIADVLEIHGHNGTTFIRWIDEPQDGEGI